MREKFDIEGKLLGYIFNCGNFFYTKNINYSMYILHKCILTTRNG